MNPMISLVVTSLFGALSWTFVIADIVRGRCVRGTRQRYVCATIQWTLVPFVATQPLWMVMVNAPIWWWPIVTVANYYCIYLLYRDDDDNWFRRKKKQLKSWAQNLSRKPVAMGARP